MALSNKFTREEYAITEDRDALISLDRKHGKLRHPRINIDKICEILEKNAPLKLRLWMRQSRDEANQDFWPGDQDKKS